MKEIPVNLLDYNEEPEWGMLPQVRPFSILPFFFAVGAKAPVYQICKVLGTTPIPEGPEGQVTAGGVSSPDLSTPTPCLVPVRLTIGGCVYWPYRAPYGTALFITPEGHCPPTVGMWQLCSESRAVLSISHRRPLSGAQSGYPQQRTDRNRKTKCQRVKVRQDFGPVQVTCQATQIYPYG